MRWCCLKQTIAWMMQTKVRISIQQETALGGRVHSGGVPACQSNKSRWRISDNPWIISTLHQVSTQGLTTEIWRSLVSKSSISSKTKRRMITRNKRCMTFCTEILNIDLVIKALLSKVCTPKLRAAWCWRSQGSWTTSHSYKRAQWFHRCPKLGWS